jgi:hypothetical protein
MAIDHRPVRGGSSWDSCAITRPYTKGWKPMAIDRRPVPGRVEFATQAECIGNPGECIGHPGRVPWAGLFWPFRPQTESHGSDTGSSVSEHARIKRKLLGPSVAIGMPLHWTQESPIDWSPDSDPGIAFNRIGSHGRSRRIMTKFDTLVGGVQPTDMRFWREKFGKFRKTAAYCNQA